MSKVRYAELERESSETRVRVVLALDGGTRRDVGTGLGFFDHLLQLLALTGHFDLGISAEGDLHVDDLHTLVDVGSVLGAAFREAAAASDPIVAVASVHMPVEDALVLAAIDLGGKGAFHGEIAFTGSHIGKVSTQNLIEFLRAFATSAGITLHLRTLAGANDHHRAEAVFKALGRALHLATRLNERSSSSTGKALIT